MTKKMQRMPYEVQSLGMLSSLLSDFKEAGGEVEYVLIGGIFPEDFGDAYAFHKVAAGFTIEAIAERYPRSSGKGPASWREPARAQGELITSADFFAPGHLGLPLEADRMLVQRMRKGAVSRSQQGLPSFDTPWGEYFHAFFEPPYDLSEPYDPHSANWFSAINYELFGENEEALTIYRWSTDWAEYFEWGHRWWGSYLWTIYSEETKTLVGIAASASD